MTSPSPPSPPATAWETPAPVDHAAMEVAITADSVRALYRAVPLALAATVANAVILALVQGPALAAPVVYGWLCAMLAVVGGRGLLARAYRRAAPADTEARPWLLRYRAGALAGGLLWGAGAWCLFPPHDPVRQGFLAMVLAGITAGALTSLAADFVSVLLFSLLALIPLALRYGSQSGPVAAGMTALTVLFALYVASNARRINGDLRDNVRLRVEAADQRRRLAEREAMLRLFFDMPFVGMGIADGEQRNIMANEAYCRLIGYTPEEFRRLGISDDVHPDDVAAERALLERMRRGEIDTYVLDQRLRRKDGTSVEARCAMRCVREPDGRILYYVGMAQDLTERRAAEAALIAARDEAERANRAKSEFLSRMSHELRTPMNAILGFGQLLEMDEALAPPQRESVREIMGAGQHLLELINDVLDLSRIEAGRMDVALGPVPLAPLAAECLRTVGPAAARRAIGVSADVAGEAVALADRTRLKQVLLNLLSNAVKYNIDGGAVALTAHPLPGGAWRLTVTDTGPGIPPARRAELFTPFSRLGAERSGVDGVGIGLVICRGLMEAMGGRIGVDDAPRGGCAFWIELPGADGPAR